MPYSSFSDQNPTMNSPDPLSAARRRGSTSQMCLRRILATIAAVPPPPPLLATEIEEEASAAADLNKCSRFDSNSAAEATIQPPSSSSSGGDGCDVDRDRDERSLCLLIEAAKLIFGEFVDEEKSELVKDAAAAEIGGEFGDAPPSSPVVRSKRGRTRVMPCRYRDSVLEPLPRFSRTGSTGAPAKRRRG